LDYLLAKEVMVLIREKFWVGYSINREREISKQIGMKFGNPCQHGYSKLKNAEDHPKYWLCMEMT